MEEKKFFAINLFSSKKLNFLAAFTRTLLVMTMCGVLNAQEITVRGQIFDASSRESIELARITIDLRDAKNTIYSDKNGVFYIQIKKNTPVKFAIERYGYFHLHYHVQASSDTSLQIQLQPNPLLLNSVSITSSRKPRLQTMQQSTKPEYRFDLELLNELATSTAAGVLNFSPGIYIKNYGGFGGLKTISLRGMSANQSKILIDGIEYDNFQTGVTDLSILDLQSFHALDVYRGGDAALYGANALSGAINLITLPASPNRQFSYEAGLGAYDDYKQHLKFSGPVASLNSTAAVTWRSAQGDHQYKFNAFGEEKSLSRQNADFENLNLLIAAQKKRERMEAGFTTLFYRGERGVPGPVLQGAFVKSKARQKDYDTQITGRFTWQTSQDSFWRTALRWRNSELNYRDPLIKITPNGIDDSYNNQTFHAQSEYEIAGKKQRLSSKIELGHSELQGNNLAKPSESAYELIDAVERTYSHVSVFWEYIEKKLNHFRALQIALRLSTYSDLAPAFSPSIGFNVKPARFLVHFRMHVAKNFRPPSFAEQYYLNYGNQTLKPERSISIDCGANLTRGSFVSDLSFFAIRVTDQIIAIPRSPVQWSTQNIGRTRNYGFEWYGEWQSTDERWRIRTTYTLQNAQDRTPNSRTHGKRLVYIPQELATLILVWRLPIQPQLTFFTSVAARYVSHRYRLQENDYSSLLPAYSIADCKAGIQYVRGKNTYQLNFLMENFTNNSYEIINAYPMPMRLWRIEGRIEK